MWILLVLVLSVATGGANAQERKFDALVKPAVDGRSAHPTPEAEKKLWFEKAIDDILGRRDEKAEFER